MLLLLHPIFLLAALCAIVLSGSRAEIKGMNTGGLCIHVQRNLWLILFMGTQPYPPPFTIASVGIVSLIVILAVIAGELCHTAQWQSPEAPKIKELLMDCNDSAMNDWCRETLNWQFLRMRVQSSRTEDVSSSCHNHCIHFSSAWLTFVHFRVQVNGFEELPSWCFWNVALAKISQTFVKAITMPSLKS